MNTNDNYCPYIAAANEQKRLFENFKDVQNLYELVEHMHGKYMSDMVAANYYKFILDNTIGRRPCGGLKSAKPCYNEFKEIIQKSNGLICHISIDEKNIILQELDRLADID